jgi:hypothetical protein
MPQFWVKKFRPRKSVTQFLGEEIPTSGKHASILGEEIPTSGNYPSDLGQENSDPGKV